MSNAKFAETVKEAVQGEDEKMENKHPFMSLSMVLLTYPLAPVVAVILGIVVVSIWR